MAGFPALNIEPEDDKVEEVDDTREIQLEEALKLYQNALRFHSLGPDYFDQAADTYKELFQSEIFRYPEAISEFARDELDAGAGDTPVIDEPLSQLNVVQSTAAQASPSSLPQIIYLSFKNYGQFLLERHAQASIPNGSPNESRSTSLNRDLIIVCSKALKQFAEALERDDTDLDLWRKAAKVAQVCISDRILRFCLESVLAGDDDGMNELEEILGLDEALAAGQLKEVIDGLQDDLSIAQDAGNEPRSDLLKLLKRTLEPFPFLTSPSFASPDPPDRKTLGQQPKRQVLRVPTRSWNAIGQALLQELNDEHQFHADSGPGAGLYIDVPADPDSVESNEKRNCSDTDPDPTKAATAIPPHEKIDTMDNVQTSTARENPLVNADESAGLERDLPKFAAQDAIQSPWLVEVAPDEVCRRENADDEGVDAPVTGRKRSAASAGHDEPPDSGRLKSKRLRNRESNADATLQEEDAVNVLAKYYEDQLKDLAFADQGLFSTSATLLSKLGIDGFGSVEDLRQDVLLATSRNEKPDRDIPPDATSMSDVRSALTSWSEEKANSVLYGHGGSTFGGGKAGLTLFLEHSKTAIPKPESMQTFALNKGLSQFTHRCNEGWYSSQQVAFDWLEALILPEVENDLTSTNAELKPSSYKNTIWPEPLKLTVVQLIVRIDDYIFQTLQRRLESLADRVLSACQDSTSYTLQDVAIADMAQTLYELHLDIYSRITNPSSQVGNSTRILQRDRLQRWSDLAGSFINIYADHADDVPLQQFHVIRFIWAATTHANLADDTSQEHTALCLEDLRLLLSHAGNPTIILPNNAAMPEISVSAVEQELSRTNTLDFFMSIFNDNSSDPVTVIESLEPILEPCNQLTPLTQPNGEDCVPSPMIPAQTQQLIDFLEAGDASLRLFLWRRLRDAYITVDYSPKVVSCYLRSIEAILSELFSRRHLRLPTPAREIALLKWIKELDDLVAKSLTKILADSTAFEMIDESHLQTSMSAISRLCRILQSIALYEDSIRVGQMPELKGKNASGTKSLDKFRDKLRDMHVRVWTLQYTLLREAIAQKKDDFDSPADEQAEYLRTLHHALGLRGYCKHSNKIFLKLLKSELMSMETKGNYSADMAQVLFDLHQLKFAPGYGDWDHDCPSEPLDKKSAAHILESVMLQARSMNIKDLLKSELKSTIDKIQHALGAPKSAPVLSYNKRIINAYLKSPINQLQLFRASRGETTLSIRTVESESATVAAHGWYFLLGHLSLAKFKSIKRSNPGPTDDLDIAVTFLKQDLEHDIENWESWFRLAQVYDAKIEEDLLWTADKLNNHRAELAALQRNTIHCYEMAMAMSVRNADETSESANVISEMYTGFATRLYASSREPLSMDAFDTKYHQRHFSSTTEQSNLYKGPSAPSMPIFSVWRFSAHLLRRALAEKPHWTNHYLLGKCLWKMLTNPEPNSRRKVLVEEVLDAFVEAIENLPERKDSRADHILEPHFKLVSVVHKLVHGKRLTPLQGSEALQATPWARDVHLAEDEDSWEPYVLEILKKLGHADKSNWHHRIIARAAHVIYDDQQNIAGALGAKHEFTQQIFTKTMVLQVWKPEHERAGRHFVYTSRYVLFFVSLLSQLNDRTSLDQLVRRIRRKPGDFLNHQPLWEELITSYVGLLRRMARVPNGNEEGVFRTMDHDEFLAHSGKLEMYAHDPETSNLVLDILRDSIELKKLNNSLMKGTLIDDLIVDCYASLYQSFVAGLPPEEKVEPNGSESKTVQHEPAQDEGNHRMKLGSILAAQADGSTESPGSVATPATQQNLTLPNPSGLAAPISKPTRPKTVTRREVQRKAENLIIRPPPIKTPTLTKHTGFPRPTVTVEVPRSSSKHVQSSSATHTESAPTGLGLHPVEGSRAAYLARDEAGIGATSADSSRPGSVHDSADDESELSELEEVENGLDEALEQEDRQQRGKPGPRSAILFPGLVRDTPDPEITNEDSSLVISDSESARNEQPERMDIDGKSDDGGDERRVDGTDAVSDEIIVE